MIIKRTVVKRDIKEKEDEQKPGEKPEEIPKTIKIGQEKAPQIIHKKIIPKNIQ